MATLLRRRRVLGAKVEVTPGTAVSLANTDCAFNAYDVEVQGDIDYDEREGQGGFSMLAGTLGGYKGTLKFKTDLYGGTSSEPTMFSVLMPACGYVDATHVYSPQTNPPGSGGVKCVTVGVFADGKFKALAGAMGTAVLTFTAGKRVSIEWTFMGVWQAPVDASIPSSISYPSTAPLRFVSSGFSINSYAYRVSTVTLDLGNQVEMEEDSSKASGYIHAIITGRKVIGKLDPEATLVATNDAYGFWLANSTGALALSLGSSGNEVSIAAPAAVFMNVQEGDRNKIEVDEIDFQCVRSSGDDELTFTLA